MEMEYCDVHYTLTIRVMTRVCIDTIDQNNGRSGLLGQKIISTNLLVDSVNNQGLKTLNVMKFLLKKKSLKTFISIVFKLGQLCIPFSRVELVFESSSMDWFKRGSPPGSAGKALIRQFTQRIIALP